MKTQKMTHSITRSYLLDHHRTLGPLYSKILGYLRSRDIERLSSCASLFDSASHSVDELRILRQVEAFYSKNADFADEAFCFEAARKSFQDSEKQCRITNRRLDFYYLHGDRLDPHMQLQISRMRSYIRKVLGPFSHFMRRLPDEVRVTSGATSTSSRRDSMPHLKMSYYPVSTVKGGPYVEALYHYFGYKTPHISYTNLNRVEVVPKSWKTHRTIACEPSGLLPLQLAFDGYVKRKLRFHKIDLSDQTVNQRLAREGSFTGALCTVDFSSASDTVAFNTVAWLFPYDWYCYLRDIRSPCYKGRFGYGRYAKFSSMGNGATFCIETLIFAAACYAVKSKNFSVYGDDVILETELFDEFEHLMRFFGFSINTKKSHTSGWYRESCGTEYYRGQLITPFFIRGFVRSKAERCHLINGVVAVSKPYGATWELLRDEVSRGKLPLVPYNMSSVSGIHIPVHEAYEEKLFRFQNSMVRTKLYLPKVRKKKVVDSRTLTLWYLRNVGPNKDVYRYYDRFLGFIELERRCSSVPSFENRYVRKWVHWIPPVTVTPDHLYSWSDFIRSYLNR